MLFQLDVSTSISLDSNEFIIAKDQENNGSSSSSVVLVVGCAQLQCLGPATSILCDPNQWYDDNDDGRMTVINITTTNNSRRKNEH